MFACICTLMRPCVNASTLNRACVSACAQASAEHTNTYVCIKLRGCMPIACISLNACSHALIRIPCDVLRDGQRSAHVAVRIAATG